MKLPIDLELIKTGFIGFARLVVTASIIATLSSILLTFPIIILSMFMSGHVLIPSSIFLVDRVLIVIAWLSMFFDATSKLQGDE